MRIVANCEKAKAEENRWEQTSAAILGLHGQDRDTIDHYVAETSKLAAAGITSRVLCEMVLCISPLTSGSRLADIDFSNLLARMALLIHIAGLSDAIYYNVLVPQIEISPFGRILFSDDFGNFVVNPMLSQMSEDRFIKNAPLQKSNYDIPEIIEKDENKINDQFLQIWNLKWVLLLMNLSVSLVLCKIKEFKTILLFCR